MKRSCIWFCALSQMAFLGCVGPPTRDSAKMAVDIDLSRAASRVALEVATATLEVSGNNMDAVSAQLNVGNGRATGSVTVPVGADRLVVIQLLDAADRVVCGASDTINIATGINRLTATLLCTGDGNTGELVVDIDWVELDAEVSVSRAAVTPGQSADVAVVVTPACDFTVAWNASVGAFDDPTSPVTVWRSADAALGTSALLTAEVTTSAGVSIERSVVVEVRQALLGEQCDVTDGCVSGYYCADGVCCDTSCDEDGYACVASLTGLEDGTCAPVYTEMADPFCASSGVVRSQSYQGSFCLAPAKAGAVGVSRSQSYRLLGRLAGVATMPEN